MLALGFFLDYSQKVRIKRHLLKEVMLVFHICSNIKKCRSKFRSAYTEKYFFSPLLLLKHQ